MGSIGDPYYTMEIVDFMGDNCAYVGTSATRTKAGNYAIIGSSWKGKLPNGVKLHLNTVYYKKGRIGACRGVSPSRICFPKVLKVRRQVSSLPGQA